jgi:hypothetical protein
MRWLHDWLSRWRILKDRESLVSKMGFGVAGRYWRGSSRAFRNEVLGSSAPNLRMSPEWIGAEPWVHVLA